jgi:hypothetical protein
MLALHVKQIDTGVVTGERSWQYARRLRFAERQIVHDLYGEDHAALSLLYDARLQHTAWPRQFLSSGRYVPVKGIDLYGSPTAWRALRGVHDLGFLHPSERCGVMASRSPLAGETY